MLSHRRGLRLVLPPQPAITDAAVAAAIREAWGRDLRGIHRAAEALAKLTVLEVDAFAAFACLVEPETAAARSWRDRMLRAATALSKIDSALYPAALLLAIRRKAWSTEPDPLSPFTVEPVQDQAGEKGAK